MTIVVMITRVATLKFVDLEQRNWGKMIWMRPCVRMKKPIQRMWAVVS